MIKKLLQGYKEFKKESLKDGASDPFKDLKNSQSPKTLVIGCSDSRVDPAIITKADVGDIFMIRNIANIVPPYEEDWKSYHGTSSAIEYAVTVLKVHDIVIMGHSNCGGIRALVDKQLEMTDKPSFIRSWINIMKDVRDNLKTNDKETKYCSCEKAGIKKSIENLMTFPFVKDAVENGELKLNGWYFNIGDASLSTLDKETGNFEKV